jgi:hypothetical protein
MVLRRRWRAVILWVVGSLLILFGSMIVGKLEMEVGVTWGSFLFALSIALILIMVGGLFWISIALYFARKKEE